MKNEVKAVYESPQSEVVSLKLSGSIAQLNVTSPTGMETYPGGGEDW